MTGIGAAALPEVEPGTDDGAALVVVRRRVAAVRRHHHAVVAAAAVVVVIVGAVAVRRLTTTQTTSGVQVVSTPNTTGIPTPTTTISAPDTTTSQTAAAGAPASGTYVDGNEGTPYYFVSLTTQPDGGLNGSVHFLYQDGQTSVVFSFSGTWQSPVATLHPTAVPQNGSASQDPATVPAAISMTYTAMALQLGERTQYLHFVSSLSQCTFSITR